MEKSIFEEKLFALKKAINEGVERGIAVDFNPANHLKVLKAKRKENAN